MSPTSHAAVVAAAAAAAAVVVVVVAAARLTGRQPDRLAGCRPSAHK
jgi:hypothetical protein